MKRIWKDLGIAFVMGLLVPTALLAAVVSMTADPPQETEPAEPTQIQSTEPAAQIRIPVQNADGTVSEMELTDYLTGVLLAELPASFEEEAKKAQAVVARTYTIRAYEGASKHDGAAVCTESSCCQGYISSADFLAKGGTQEAVEAARNAVLQTGNDVLTYDGNLIEATYFSCSGGSTEDAVAVWGTDVPYLRATSSPGEENASHYTDTITFTAEEFASALALDLQGDPASWLGPVTYTAGGGVNTMMIGGISFEGTALRKILNLRSTAFTMTAAEEGITVTTRGYGHRVGMSQYGADAMAASGSDYAEILAHYYQGTSLVSWMD